jgi:hypothetical protein
MFGHRSKTIELPWSSFIEVPKAMQAKALAARAAGWIQRWECCATPQA